MIILFDGEHCNLGQPPQYRLIIGFLDLRMLVTDKSGSN